MGDRITHCYNVLLSITFILLVSSLSGQKYNFKNSFEATEQFEALEAISPFTLNKSAAQNADLSEAIYLDLNEASLLSISKQKNQNLHLVLPLNGISTDVYLVPANIQSEDYKIKYASGKKIKASQAQHYWGIVSKDMNSMVSLTIRGDEIFGLINVKGQSYNLGKIKDTNIHVLYEQGQMKNPPQLSCDMSDDLDFSSIHSPQKVMSDPDNCVNLYVEVVNTIYSFYGDGTEDYILGAFSQVALLYANEAINIKVSELVIWDEQEPYAGPSTFEYLTQFRNALGGNYNGDLAHLVGVSGGGGIAYVNVLCNKTYGVGYSAIASSYSNVPTYSWTVSVLAHELGHNLGSNHTHACVWNGNNTAIDDCGNYYANNTNQSVEGAACYDQNNPILPAEGGTVMSYCHLVNNIGIDFNLGFGSQPGELLRNRVYNAPCLVPCGNNCTPGDACDDQNVCTTNDILDGDCNCIGNFQDSDGDGVCDAEDQCPNGNDNIDNDNDGIPDACDDCNLSGSCDDGNICTVNDVYDENCNCVGNYMDADQDGVCDAEDQCPGANDNIDSDADGIPDACDNCNTGFACNDGSPCTSNDVYDENCNCIGEFQDADMDGVCDAEDQCPNGDDNLDSDNDGVPDACDNCIAGEACDDNDPCTINDALNENCQCIGQEISCEAELSEHIHVDQFGYYPLAKKIAVLSDPQVGFNSDATYVPSQTMQVKRVSDNAVVYTNEITEWREGIIHAQSGDRGWWFDFTDLELEGEYYVFDPEANQRSPKFKISCSPYDGVMSAAFKSFYYNRCNATKSAPYAAAGYSDGMNFMNSGQDSQCRYAFDPNNASLERDLSGGWFDAGDYNKYVTFAYPAVQALLSTYEDNPYLFGDDMNIPESGNGISDLLDEIKWELDWLLKMTNADGSVIQKMGSLEYDQNAAAPPSNNTDRRYYSHTCTSASIAAAGMLAHAAKVYMTVPGYQNFSTTLLSKSVQCFGYFLSAYNNDMLEEDCDDQTVKSGDADWSIDQQIDAAIVAATYIFEITGSNIYRNFIDDNYGSREPISNNYWGPYKTELEEALLIYAKNPQASSASSSNILSVATAAVQNDYSNIYGFNDSDLYRAHAMDWNYHWGSNQSKANNGNLNLIFTQNDIAQEKSESMMYMCKELLHYFHGVNPLGLVYLSNMYDYGAERSANEIYHTWFNDGTAWDNAKTSQYGPAPGFVVGGPNKNFSVSTMTPPYGQPIQKSYLDYNTGWPSNSWELTEPAIYYQAAYLRLLSNIIAVQNESCSDCDNIGLACNDNDPCTTNDHIDANCNCVGEYQDSDLDGVCDINDQCPGFNDNNDEDQDGIPDGCDDCQTGQSCSDNNACTVDDQWDENCNCVGTYIDSDQDGVCDAEDVCPGGNDSVDVDQDGVPDACDPCITDLACDDGNNCTENDRWDENCNCVGDYMDSDQDGVCDAEDVCPGSNDNLDSDQDGIPDACDDCQTGQSCNDGDICTVNDIWTAECDCVGQYMDSDSDGICDVEDQCPGSDDTIDIDQDGIPDACDDCLTGEACNDGNSCTINDSYDSNCNCIGDYIDSDQDGVCDADDVCPGGNDAIDADQDGIPDACDECLNGRPCDDGYSCTVNDTYDADCNCIGEFQDQDEDGVCDLEDQCPGGDDTIDSDQDGIPDACDECQTGMPCSDGNSCTVNDVWTIDCNCVGQYMDSDSDGVCDAEDQCPNFDDKVDADQDGIPDACDECQTGDKCNDGDDCTVEDRLDKDCNCVGIYMDSDQDGVCNAEDVCPGGNDNIDADEDGIPDACDECQTGASCSDGDACTIDDVWTEDCNCVGTFLDADNDGVCDAEDVCPGGNDNIDADEDGIPDACDECQTGQACNDGDDCTVDDVWDASCNCIGVYLDDDNDGVCNAEDQCPGGNDNRDRDNDGIPDACDECITGRSCNDGDDCTANDVWDADCNCIGEFQDSDFDGICDSEDQCPGGDDTIDKDKDGIPDACDECQTGQSCDDGDLCTIGDSYDAECNCIGEYLDDDNDGVCNVEDQCPGGNDNIDADEDGIPDACDECQTGQSCNDGYDCTVNDVWDEDCNCVGEYQDSDEDGVCDAEDICSEGDDNMDADQDGIPDACDECQTGQSCDDGDDCTVNDVWDEECNCVGEYQDSDEDGVCDAEDICSEGDDNMDADQDGIPDACDECQTGQSCNDGDDCTINDVWDEECNCVGEYQDSDADGVCDAEDQCPGQDDTLDQNGNGQPDGCEDCTPTTTALNPNVLTHEGDGSTTWNIDFGTIVSNVQFDINQIGSETNGWRYLRYRDKVTVSYIDEFGLEIFLASYTGSSDDSAPIYIDDRITAILIEIEDTYHNYAYFEISVSLSDISYCITGDCVDSDQDTVCDEEDQCPGRDDRIDLNNNGIPDGCEPECDQVEDEFEIDQLSHFGFEPSILTYYINGIASNVSFELSDLDAQLRGRQIFRYVDEVVIVVKDENGEVYIYDTVRGDEVSDHQVFIYEKIQAFEIRLQDGYDGYSLVNQIVTFDNLEYCLEREDLDESLKQRSLEIVEPKVFPNPFSQFLTIQLPTDAGAYFEYSIFDVQGKLVKETAKVEGSVEQIEGAQLGPDGIYIIRIKTEDGQLFNRRVILQKE